MGPCKRCFTAICSKNTILSGQMTSSKSPGCSIFFDHCICYEWIKASKKKSEMPWKLERVVWLKVNDAWSDCIHSTLFSATVGWVTWERHDQVWWKVRFKWKEIGSLTCYWTVRHLCHIACDSIKRWKMSFRGFVLITETISTLQFYFYFR